MIDNSLINNSKICHLCIRILEIAKQIKSINEEIKKKAKYVGYQSKLNSILQSLH